MLLVNQHSIDREVPSCSVLGRSVGSTIVTRTLTPYTARLLITQKLCTLAFKSRT